MIVVRISAVLSSFARVAGETRGCPAAGIEGSLRIVNRVGPGIGSLDLKSVAQRWVTFACNE